MPSSDRQTHERADPHVASVIIPAHNEALVIERCLRSILTDHRHGELDIVVACNGCTDDTAAIAAAVDPSITVVSTSEASKWGALDLGDAHAAGFPRMYVDADVAVSPRAIQTLADAMQRNGAAIGAPTLRFPDFSASSMVVRLFYRGWRHSPYFDDKLIGFGFYALSSEGRSRFDTFPETMAEDYFLHRLFTAGERHVDDSSWFTPLLPTTVRDIVAVHARQLAANATLTEFAAGEGHDLPEHHAPATWLPRAARQPAAWPALATFVVLRVVAVLLSVKRRRQRTMSWTRDSSTHGPSGT